MLRRRRGGVDDEADFLFGCRRREDLDHGVGVHDGGRLERRHDDHPFGEPHQLHHVVGHAGRGIEEEIVEVGADPPDDDTDLVPLIRTEGGQRSDAAACRDDADAERSFDGDLFEGPLTVQEMTQVKRRREAQEHVDVAQTEIRVEDTDTMAQSRQGDRQVDDHVGLPDSALSAGDGDDGGAGWRGVRLRHDGMRAVVTTSPSTESASLSAVARRRSSGTRCPVPR
jgi:hypothetical protein